MVPYLVSADKLSEVFRVLSNPVNIELLVILSSGEFNPRELAKHLGRDETDVSRRLRRLEKAGLVVGEWRRVAGRNVRIYKPRSKRFCLSLTADGISLSTIGELEPRSLARRLGVSLRPPRPPSIFVGRGRELGQLRSLGPGLVVVLGLPGSGKTSLLARAVEEWRGAVAWYTVTGAESLGTFLWKLSLYLSLLGYHRLFEYLQQGEVEVEEAANILAEGMDKFSLSLVIDDFHKLSDKEISLLVARVARRIESSRIILASRRRPTTLVREVPGTKTIVLGGLDTTEARKLLASLGIELDPVTMSELYASTQGHPLLLRLFAELASRVGVEKAVSILHSKGFGREIWNSIVESLSPAEAEVLGILVDIGEPVPAELVSSLCRCRGPLVALYRLVDSGLVDEFGDRFAARDIVKKLYASHVPRRGIVVRAANWFLKKSGAEDIVTALKLFTKAGDEKGIARAIRARIARVGLEIEAWVEPYRRALVEALESVRSGYTRAHLLVELASALRDKGLYREAAKMLQEARSLAAMYHNVVARLQSIGLLLWFYPGLLGEDEVESLVAEAEQVLSNVKRVDPVAAKVISIYYANLARYYAFRGDSERVLQAVREELAASEKTGDTLDIALSRAHLAIALGLMGRLDEALSEAESALNSLLASGVSPGSPTLARLYGVIAEIHARRREYREAYRNAYEAYSVIEETGNPTFQASLLGIQVISLINMGSYSIAYSVARRLAEKIEKLGPAGLELSLLAVAAAYKLAGKEYHRLARTAIESLRTRTTRLLVYEAVPYLEAMRVAGMEEELNVLEKMLVQP